MEQREFTNLQMEMGQKADGFLTYSREYLNGKHTEEDLTRHTTQPFWRSMTLSKDRFDSKGLVMDMGLRSAKKRTILPEGIVKPSHEGNQYVGTSERRVISQKSYYKNGKLLKSFKDCEVSRVNLIKANVMGEQFECLNCGHIGTISSYINGCDYCNQKFKVSDFETKVSGFTLEEDTQSKLTKNFKKTALVSLLAIFLIFATAVLALFAIVAGVSSSRNGAGAINGIILFMLAGDLFPVVLKTAVVVLILYIFGGAFLFSKFRSPIIGQAIVKATLPDFSAYDFAQNLDYKLKNIFLADHVKQVAAFANCDLSELVNNNHDIIECQLSRLTFLHISQVPNGYQIQVKVKLKLTMYNGKRIKIKHKSLRLELLGSSDVCTKNVNAIRAYPCHNCGSNIDILNGGVCEYCGTALNKYELGWVINSFEMKSIRFNQYRTTTVLALFLMAAVFAINLATHETFKDADGEDWYDFYTTYNESQEVLAELFDNISLPTEMDPALNLSDKKEGKLERKYVYSTDSGAQKAADYAYYLSTKDYILYTGEMQNEGFHIYKPEVVKDESGYIAIEVTFDDKSLTVELYTAENVGE